LFHLNIYLQHDQLSTLEPGRNYDENIKGNQVFVKLPLNYMHVTKYLKESIAAQKKALKSWSFKIDEKAKEIH
jgi:hypothetical protein